MSKIVSSYVAPVFVGLFGLVFALIAVEVAFRVIDLKPKLSEGWDDRPTFYYIPEGAEYMRDAPHLASKPPNTYRIAVVGDSFSFAPYMQFDDTFAARLERMLNMNKTQEKGEVVNYGVPAYSTHHEIALVERAIREQANLVLLQITLNDPELKPYRPTGLDLNAVNRFGQLDLSNTWYKYWKSAAFVRARLFNNQSRDRYVEYFFSLFDSPRTFNNFSSSVSRMSELCKKANIPLVAVIFPLFGVPLDDSYPFIPIHDKISEFMRQAKIPTLDLFPAYKGIPHDRLKVMPIRDFHPNEIAHRIAAERIYLWLEEQGFIPAALRIKWRSPTRTDIRLPENLPN